MAQQDKWAGSLIYAANTYGIKIKTDGKDSCRKVPLFENFTLGMSAKDFEKAAAKDSFFSALPFNKNREKVTNIVVTTYYQDRSGLDTLHVHGDDNRIRNNQEFHWFVFHDDELVLYKTSLDEKRASRTITWEYSMLDQECAL